MIFQLAKNNNDNNFFLKSRSKNNSILGFSIYLLSMYIIYHKIYTCVSKTKYDKYVTEYNGEFVRYTFYLRSEEVYK